MARSKQPPSGPRPDDADALPESAIGGTSDSGAQATPPTPSLNLTREYRSALAGKEPGDASIDRRRHASPDYRGPERRIAKV